MEQAIKIMMQIIRSAMCETPVDKELKSLLTPGILQKIYKISCSHDVAHIIGATLEKNECLPEGIVAVAYLEQEMTAVYRYERLNFEYNEICKILEEAEIDFMPLKGAVLREYYPEPWMRTSCDIDILVHKKDLKKAEDLLIQELHYTEKHKSTHDVTLCSVNDVSIELHYDLVEDNRAKDSNKVLKDVWKYSYLRDNYKHSYCMNSEMFCFYHIAHIAKHFEIGGCGIRPLLDLWLLDNKGDFWNPQTEKLLKQGGLLRFAHAIGSLSEVWFSEREHDEITYKMQTYILQGGVYGTEENHIVMRNHRAGGRIKYILSRIFVPYYNLKYEFPILQKYRILTPIFEVYRWILQLFRGNKKKRIDRLNSIKHVPEEHIHNVADMMEKIGL